MSAIRSRGACGAGVAGGEVRARGGQFGWADDVDVRVEAADGGGESGPRPGAEGEPAAIAAECLDDSVPGEGRDVGGREVQDDVALAGPVGGSAVTAAESAGDEGGHAAAGELAWREARAGGGTGPDALDAERAPVLAV